MSKDKPESAAEYEKEIKRLESKQKYNKLKNNVEPSLWFGILSKIVCGIIDFISPPKKKRSKRV